MLTPTISSLAKLIEPLIDSSFETRSESVDTDSTARKSIPDGGSPHRINAEKSLIPLAINEISKNNIFLIHAHGGLVMWYRALAKELGTSLNVFGLQSRGLTERNNANDTVEEMATAYIEEIVKHQPEGPYFIGGHSMGGTIAWEIAKQLDIQGRDAAWIGMIQSFHRDMPYPFPRGDGAAYADGAGFLKKTRLLWDRLCYIPKRNTGKNVIIAIVNSLMNALVRKFTSASSRPSQTTVENIELQNIHSKNTNAFWNYEAPELNKTVNFYTSEHQPQQSINDRTLGWQKLALGTVNIRVIPDSSYLSTGLLGEDAKICAEMILKDIHGIDDSDSFYKS